MKIARKTQGAIFELRTIVNGLHAAYACTPSVALMQQLHLLESEKSFAPTLNKIYYENLCNAKSKLINILLKINNC